MSNIRSASSRTMYVTRLRLVTRPLLAVSRSSIRPGVQTTSSAPFFISAICSEMGDPPYAHMACRKRSNPHFNVSHLVVVGERKKAGKQGGHAP